MKLSIITPYYKTYDYTVKLASKLMPQVMKHSSEVEWIIVDDGCYEFELDKLGAKVIHLVGNFGTASTPRNIGLDNAIGEYIAFIDSDDMVSDDYVDLILDKINSEPFDYCFYGWKTDYGEFLILDEAEEWNTCVWNCVYNKNLIGNERFDEKVIVSEDAIFNKKVRKGKRVNIPKIIYFYTFDRPNGISNRYGKQEVGWRLDM